MESNIKNKEIDTCNGDDLEIAMAYTKDDEGNEALVALLFRDEYYEGVSDKNKHRHEHVLLFTPELAVGFANNLLEFAKNGFVYNVTAAQKESEELSKKCPF